MMNCNPLYAGEFDSEPGHRRRQITVSESTKVCVIRPRIAHRQILHGKVVNTSSQRSTDTNRPTGKTRGVESSAKQKTGGIVRNKKQSFEGVANKDRGAHPNVTTSHSSGPFIEIRLPSGVRGCPPVNGDPASIMTVIQLAW